MQKKSEEEDRFLVNVGWQVRGSLWPHLSVFTAFSLIAYYFHGEYTSLLLFYISIISEGIAKGRVTLFPL